MSVVVKTSLQKCVLICFNQQQLTIKSQQRTCSNGIKDRIIEFYNFLTSNNIHIACICETFLKKDIHPHTHPEFTIERLDRNDNPRGGVAIIIRKSLQYELLPNLNTKIFEAIGIEIKTINNTKIKIISTYLPGGTSNHQINLHFANDIRKMTNWINNYFIFVHRLWNCSRANRAGTILYDELCIGLPSTYF